MRAIFGGEVQKLLGRQRMEKNLAALEGHLLVCGFGRMGHLVCDEFSSHGLPFVVMDTDPAMLADFHMPHGIAVTGDATSDEDLKHVGVERARALVAALPSDAGNVYITMSARFLNPELYIVARAEGEAADKKLLRAGANRVVSPYRIGGQRVAQAVLRPAVIDFIDLATSRSHLELQIEETEVKEGSSLIGQPLRSSGLRRELGIILVAIMKPGGSSVFNPSGEVIIQQNDVLIGLGSRQQLDRLEVIAGAREPAKV